MQEIQKNNQLNNFEDDIDLMELFHVLWRGKKIIVFITAFVSIIGIIYSIQLPNIYESKATLTSTDSSSSISNSMQNFSRLSGIAGINLPNGADNSISAQALERVKSLSFFENNIFPKIFLPDLMAFKSWDYITNTHIYDDKIYNADTNVWVRDFSYPHKQIPSAQESFNVFITNHLNISEDTNTGFISLKIKHQSPYIAKKWAKLIVNEVNTFYRSKDKSESEKSVDYLNKKIAVTNFSQVKEAVAQLLQQETKKLALIEANEFYVYEYIDPPVVMEIKSEPRRAFICILSALLGGMLSILFVLIRHYIFTERSA